MARGERHRGRVLLFLFLILVVLVVGADLIGRVVAEREIATQTKTQLSSEDITTKGNPSVKISGWPFLTQVASGHYGKINIVIPEPSSKGVTLTSLNVTATGVNAPASTVLSGGGQIEADKVVGTGRIAWSAFTQMVDLSGLQQYGVDPDTLKISGAADGTITVAAPVKIGNQSFTAIASGVISVTHNLLHVKINSIKSDGATVPAVLNTQLQAISAQLTFDARIPTLPYNLVLDSVQANSGGVTITASAVNVVLGR